MTVQAPIGGDFALDWTLSVLPDIKPVPYPLFATGRDALAVIAQRIGQNMRWLIPEFMCPVVPDTLRKCGTEVESYAWHTPWQVDSESLKTQLADADAIIVPFHMGLAPQEGIWQTLSKSRLTIVEDRCQCVGAPPAKDKMRGHYAIGSFRKWLPTPDGAYGISREGEMPQPVQSHNHSMTSLRYAAGMVREARRRQPDSHWYETAEKLDIELFKIGESLAETDFSGHAASPFARNHIAQSDFDTIIQQRLRNQSWLAKNLSELDSIKILEPTSGAFISGSEAALALPILSEKRGELRARLAAHQVFCAIHWIDGDWSGRGGQAARWAEQLLSLPIDQRYTPDDLQTIVDCLT